MSKIAVKIVTIGYMPREFNKQKIEKWYSNIFIINEKIENYPLRKDSDGFEWEFTNNLEEVVLTDFKEDFLLAIVNVPLELNWYVRRLNKNRIVI